VVTDEPSKPIDQPTQPPEPAAADTGVAKADSAPASRPAGSADPPVEASATTQAAGQSEPESGVEQAPEESSQSVEAERPAEASAEPVAAEAPSEEDLAQQSAPASEKEEEKAEEEKSDQMDWYILKVQSNREESIRDGLMRRVAIAGLGRYFGEVIVPMEQVTEFKGGKKRVTKRKLYPGYLVVQMEINDDTWFLVRETPGIGDFTGAAGHPTPMLPHEVARIVAKHEEKGEETPKLKIAFRPGDRVKINEGTFENFEGEVHAIDETNGRVTVMINIFGRSTPVELEYWQIESV
jgi:transcriptional antiterminator NusG